MQYVITFLEGIISFISPCMLPMLPIYVSYFAGGDKKRNPLYNAIAFVLGFTVVFLLFGLFAGTIGAFFTKYQTAVNIVSGIIVILFGLNYLNIIHIPFFHSRHHQSEIKGVFSAFLFGLIFSISHTPCIGAFLGSAIMMASGSGTAVRGLLLLLTYSLGMGIPFLISAVLIDKLKTLFNAIKSHYRVINIICGIFLILVGIAMMFGWLHSLLHLLEGGGIH